MSITLVPNIICKEKKIKSSYEYKTEKLLAQADNQHQAIELYKYIHTNFHRFVNADSGIEFRRSFQRTIGESGLFESFNLAYNAAVRASGPYNRGQNIRHGDTYIETWTILNYRQFNRQIYPQGLYTEYDVNRWDIVKEIKYA